MTKTHNHISATDAYNKAVSALENYTSTELNRIYSLIEKASSNGNFIVECFTNSLDREFIENDLIKNGYVLADYSDEGNYLEISWRKK